MITEVHLKDEQTVLQLPSRNALRALLEHDPADDWRGETAFICWSKRAEATSAGNFGLQFNDGPAWQPIRLTYLRRASLGLVCAAQRPCGGVLALRDERAAKWESKQATEAERPQDAPTSEEQ